MKWFSWWFGNAVVVPSNNRYLPDEGLFASTRSRIAEVRAEEDNRNNRRPTQFRYQRLIAQGFSAAVGLVDTLELSPDHEIVTIRRGVIVKIVDDCWDRHRAMQNMGPEAEMERELREQLRWEYVVMKSLGESDIGPKAHAMTRSRPLEGTSPPQWTSKFIFKNFGYCKVIGAQHRKILQEKVGPTLFNLQKQEQGVSRQFTVKYLKVFIQALEKLRQLHELGFVHGDIHNTNIAFSSNNFNEVRFIDFGLAVFYPDSIGSPVEGKPLNEALRASLLSPWQLAGQRPGPRDDVYRLILTIANCLSRDSLFPGIAELKERQWLQFKNDLELREFELKYFRQVRENLYIFRKSEVLGSKMMIDNKEHMWPLKYKRIRESMEAINLHVLSYDHPDTRIEYNWIRNQLEKVIAILE